MYCNGLPERNIGFIPYVQEILALLEDERLAISPQLNLKLEGGREMNKQDMVDHGIDDGIDGPGEEDGPWAEGWEERSGGTKGGDITDATEVPREVQSRSLLHHKVGVCPQCEGDMYVVSTKKAFGKANQACQCESCNYSENR